MSGSDPLTTNMPESFAKNSLPYQCGVDLEEIAALYLKFGSVARVAKKLGFSVKTTAKWLRAAGVKLLGHRPHGKPSPRMQTEYNVLVKWQRTHPGEKLPPSVAEASRVIGCKESALRAVIDRRRKRAVQYLERFPPINKARVSLEATNGRLVNTAFLNDISYQLDPFTNVVTMKAKVRDFEFIFKLPYAKLLSILKSVVR